MPTETRSAARSLRFWNSQLTIVKRVVYRPSVLHTDSLTMAMWSWGRTRWCRLNRVRQFVCKPRRRLRRRLIWRLASPKQNCFQSLAPWQKYRRCKLRGLSRRRRFGDFVWSSIANWYSYRTLNSRWDGQQKWHSPCAALPTNISILIENFSFGCTVLLSYQLYFMRSRWCAVLQRRSVLNPVLQCCCTPLQTNDR